MILIVQDLVLTQVKQAVVLQYIGQALGAVHLLQFSLFDPFLHARHLHSQ